MNQRTQALFVAVAALFITASCGKKLSPMTAEQKTRFRASIEHVGSLSNAVEKAQGTAKAKNKTAFAVSPEGESMLSQVFESLSQLNAEARMATGGKVPTKDERGEQMGATLSSAIESGACVMKPLEMPNKGSKIQSIQLSLTGDKCPLSLDLSVSGSGDEKGGDLSFKFSFQLKDEAFRKLSDIDSATLGGKIAFKVSESSMSASLAIDGDVKSIKEGSIGFYTKGEVDANSSQGNMSGGKAEIAFGLKFKDFTGELKLKMESRGEKQPVVGYLVNDEEVTAEEFQSYLGTLAKKLEGVGK